MSDLSTRPDIITVNNIIKEFTVRKNKSLKERIVNVGRAAKFDERFTALNDVSFTVKAGESIGLIGANGSGKSTMLKMIGGILTPDSGNIQVRGRIAALLELGTGFHPDLTGRENIYLNASMLGLSDEEIENSIGDIIAFSGISNFIDTQVKFYSSGMYVRLAFAVAVHSNPDILLVDEVLAVGDEPFQQKCMNKIKEFQEEGRSIILVSHNAGHITEICDRAIILDHGTLVGIQDPVTGIETLRHMYDEQAAREEKEVTAASLFDPGDNPECVIENVRITEGLTINEETQENYIAPGSTVSFTFDLSTPTVLDEYEILFEIRDTRKQFIFGTSSLNIDNTLAPIEGEGHVVLTIPNFNLGSGFYNANLVFKKPNGRGLARRNNAISFNVRSDDASNGFVYAIPRITMG